MVLLDQAVELTVLPHGAKGGFVSGRLSRTAGLPPNIVPKSSPLQSRNSLTKLSN